MTTSLEYLPDEILLIICQYLSQYDIVLAFFGLNNRLNCTISQFTQTLIISNENCSTHRENYQLLSIIGPYLHSLTIKNIHLSSSEISIASNIQELTFIHTQPDDIPPLRNLTDLNIIYGSTIKLIDVLFPKKNNKNNLHSVYIASISPLKIPIFSPQKFSKIKQLAIPLQSFDDLVHLLYICPELTCLNVMLQTCNFINIQNLDKQLTFETPSTLRSFSLRTTYDLNISFNQLKCILKHLTSKLEHISIEIYTEDISCIDGQQWENYLKENLSELNYFEFLILLRKDYSHGTKPLQIPEVIKTFQSAYWSKITPQNITGYYDRLVSICIHTEIIPTVRRRRYFLY
ncbi:unnamed protein product [Rotaria sordida]|uniref:F-box domain-containing protein n=1 Tax=Rotaria sordida TaxID=392033 RepID=A0A814C5W8_9BILA|nr:unnamed protein product [Rotaria sordida]CAF0935660.1 unnamed protein product [Rotaria sordida]CAF3849938.1 unnamed protein product [Rotaria sordida]CAF3901822.1 unnamed protein product [Rotaria sordida]